MERLPRQITCIYWAEGYTGRTEEQRKAHEQMIDEQFEKELKNENN